MKPSHDDDERYCLDGISRADLGARLIRAQTDADATHAEAAVLRAALRRIAAAVGLDVETVPAHVADAVEHYVRLTGGD